MLGIDLTGLAVVAAAFAAGLGFGLRDLANNFFSGILLLVERPFRTGDIISLGEFEGEIVHTGMRSMTIRSWDRMEVIIPNSDMFTKAFVNWTHQDSIVRSVITIKVNHMCWRIRCPYLSFPRNIREILSHNPTIRKC